MRDASDRSTPTLLRIRADVAPNGVVIAFGLCYRPSGTPATLAALARAGHASLLVDTTDIGAVLVRDPSSGDLLRAACTRHAYAEGLTLPSHAAARRARGFDAVPPTLRPIDADVRRISTTPRRGSVEPRSGGGAGASARTSWATTPGNDHAGVASERTEAGFSRPVPAA